MTQKIFHENKLSIRRATLNDVAIMADIYYQALERICGDFPADIRKEAVDTQIKHQTNHMLDKENHILVTHVKEHPEEVISYTIFKKNTHDIFISDLYAKSNKLGAGTMLISEVAKIAQQEKKKFIAVNELPNARGFYFKNQFIDEPLIRGMIRPIDPVSKKSISYSYVKKFLGHLIP